jgi:hypothetical protein
MQSKQNKEHELVKICMTELCTKAGFSNADNLVQRDLAFLCETVESKTGVLISLSTIKRLLNGQFSRLPQIATLDAIAVSAGYQNWRYFTLSKNHEAEKKNGAEMIKGKVVPKARYIVFGIVLILASFAVLAIITSNKSNPGNIDKAHFSAQKVTGNNIPNTVIFKYNIDSVKADSFFIQQSWDRNRRVRIYKNNYTLTDIYYEPGYHTAKLIANDQIIKTAAVSIPTDRWLFYANERVIRSKPKYIIPANGFDSGSLKLTLSDVLNSKIDIQRDNDFVAVYFPSRIEYSSDNFVMKFRIRIKEVNNEPCLRLMSEVFCQYYFMYFENTFKGCTSELTAQFGEHFLSGKSHDFSMLGADIREWQDMEFTVKDKKVGININGKSVFSSVYNQSCGLITGLGFTANGLCEVEFVDLKTADGKNIYSNDFRH